MATITLRPNAAGSTQSWSAEGGDYTRVDEVSSDGDTTRLYSPTDNVVATFGLDNSSGEIGTINSVTVYINTRGVDPVSNTVQLAVRVSSTDYFSGTKTYNNTSYHEESNAWATNPNTSVAWTWAEIDVLQAGMKRIGGGGQAVTQVWAVVDYTAASLEQEGFRFRSDDGSETTATWLASQDSSITRALETNTRIRLLVNATNDPGSIQYQLEYRKNGGSWARIPTSGEYSAELTSGGTASASHENQPSEGSDEAFDDSSSTKWLAFNTAPRLQYRFGSAATHKVTKYAITSGNDDNTRDPKDFTLQGSNDGSSWTTVDTVTGEAFATRGLRKEFVCDTPGSTAYEYYRLNISLNNGNGSITQLAELQLYKDLQEDIMLASSSNITASGENTTVQLSAPSGKTTGDFVVGRIQDDENPADLIDITNDDYTEVEWCIVAKNNAINTDVMDFRVTSSGVVLSVYSVTPQWTIGAGSSGVLFVKRIFQNQAINRSNNH